MAETTRGYADTNREPNTWALGLTVFAASMMLINGFFEILAGIVAVADDTFIVRAPNYTYSFDTTTWGWGHIVLGAVVALAGVGVFLGSMWGRILGVIVVMVQMLWNFLFIPYYPIWSLLLIALDVAVIWALSQSSIQKADLR